MWGIKISDNVRVNEDEPEVFINAEFTLENAHRASLRWRRSAG